MVYFRDRAASGIARLCDSLLRADWNPGAGAARKWPAPLRRGGALSAGGGAESAGGGIYARRDPAVILRLPAVDAGFATLEENRGTKDGGVGCQDCPDPKHAEALEKTRNLVRL